MSTTARPGTPSRSDDDRTKARFACALVAYAFGFEPDALEQPRQTHRTTIFRQMAMYLLHVGYGVSLVRVAMAFGCDRSTAAYACRRVEDARDDPDFDARLGALEDALRLAPEPVPPDAADVREAFR